MPRITIVTLAVLGVPTATSAQLGPEHPADGFLSGEPVPLVDAASRCITEIQPAPSDIVSYSTCTLVKFDTLFVVPSSAVFAARYVRWIRSSDVDWLDSLQVDEVVLLESADVDSLLATPVWHRVGYHNFLSLLDWGQHDGVHLVQLYNCVRGTGGCVEDVLFRNDTQWSALELSFVDELAPYLPTGYRVHKGRRIDLSTLHFEQPISTSGDPNCCPSAALIGTLWVDGQRLRLESARLAR